MQTIPTGQRVLIIEDEVDIAMFIMNYLKREGFVVRHAVTGKAGLEILESEPIQILLLDLMLPDIDGMDICKQIRDHEKFSNLPIIMLTARDDDVDKISGLEVGADDYITKPFKVNELVARVKALLRRSRAKTPKTAKLEIGGLSLNQGKRTATLGEKDVKLTPKEFDLLWEILSAEGNVLSREKLLETVWGYTFYGDTRTVDVHVRQLRRKLGDSCPISTVWGKGYRSIFEAVS